MRYTLFPFGDPRVQPTGMNDDHVHVVVVGANVAGTCAARAFAEAGVPVLLTGPLRSADHGLVYCGLPETPVRLRDALGAAQFAELTAFVCRAPHLLRVPTVRADGVWAAVAPGEDGLMAPSARALGETGVAATVIDREELGRMGIRAAIGLRVAGEALVDPEEALGNVFAQAVSAGARWTEEHPIALVPTSAGIGVDLPGGRVHTEIVVLTDGVLASRLVPWLRELLVPVREQALLVEATLPPLVGRAGHGHTWFRPWREHVAVGGARWATPHLEVGETVPEIVAVVHARLEAFVRDRLGSSGAVVHRWAWIDSHSCDGLPLVGPLPGDPRVVVCAGFGGNEWGFGPPAAAAVVHGTLGGEGHDTWGQRPPVTTPALFSPSRFIG